MPELFHVSFDYDVRRAGRNGGAGKPAVRRARAAIEIAVVRRSDLPVAYRVQHERDLGPGWHLILRHDGKLWWPIVERTLLGDVRVARDFLRELRAGQSDLFVRKSLDHVFPEPRRGCCIIHDDYSEALATIQRNAADLLIVDDGLYAAGGVPLLVDAFGRIHIASIGADRAVAAPAGALRIKPANGHMKIRDPAICGGRLYTAGSLDLEIAMERRRFKFHGVRIEALDGDAIDPIVVRIDASFRTAWTAMHRSIPRTRPEGFELLRTQFAEACGADGDDRLTGARYRALQGFVELFATAERRPVAVRECLHNVQRTLYAAAGSPCVLPPQLELTDEYDAAIASLL